MLSNFFFGATRVLRTHFLPDGENVESLLFLELLDRLICRFAAASVDWVFLAGWVGYQFGAMLEGMVGSNISQSPDDNFVLADLMGSEKPYRFDHHTAENNFPFEFDCMIRKAGKIGGNLF